MMKYTKEEITTAAGYTAIGETLLNDLFQKIEELRLERQQNNGKPLVRRSKPKHNENWFKDWDAAIKKM